MVNRADPTVKFISLSELDAVVEQAAADGWQDLTLVGPDGAPTNEALEHTFYLRESLRGPPPRLAALPALTSLNLRSNGLEHAGIRALAALSGLTSLNLSDNRIDDAGASELTALTSLMSLDLGNNQIGADGATALAALGGLTSLDLRGNRIDDAGASALSALTGMTGGTLFKVVYPLIFTAVPIGTYFLARRVMTRRWALIALVILLAQRNLSQQMPGLARQEIGVLGQPLARPLPHRVPRRITTRSSMPTTSITYQSRTGC
jgi:Leucine-rich repeat (LRR) protein